MRDKGHQVSQARPDLGDRFLFWAADRFGISIDALYSRPVLRLAICVLNRMDSAQ
jgi:hypothetical protein